MHGASNGLGEDVTNGGAACAVVAAREGRRVREKGKVKETEGGEALNEPSSSEPAKLKLEHPASRAEADGSVRCSPYKRWI